MSRFYVKNLPLKCSENDIRDHFREAGTITDIALQYSQEGKFKRIAFIGLFESD